MPSAFKILNHMRHIRELRSEWIKKSSDEVEGGIDQTCPTGMWVT